MGHEILLRRYYHDVVMTLANIWWWHYYDFYSDAHVGDEILLTWWCSDTRITVLTTSWCSDCDWCSNDRWRNATTIMFKWWHDYCCKDLDVLHLLLLHDIPIISVIMITIGDEMLLTWWCNDNMITVMTTWCMNTVLTTWWWRDGDCYSNDDDIDEMLLAW